MDKRDGVEDKSSKTYIGVAEQNKHHCCDSKVTVNGQHICRFT